MRRQSIWMRSMVIAGFVLALGISTSSGVVAAEKSRAANQVVKRVAAAKLPENKVLRVTPSAQRSKPERLQPSQIDPAWFPRIVIVDH